MRHRLTRCASRSFSGRSLHASTLATLLVLGLFAARSLSAQPPFEDDEFRRGLIGTYQSDGHEFQRIDPTINFDGAVGSDPRLAAGPFEARWSGFLMSQATGDYRLHAFVQGRFKLTLNDTVLLQADHPQPAWVSSETLRLPFDWHPVQIEWSGDAPNATVSLYWEGPKFGLEPIPDRHLYHDPQNSPPLDQLSAFARGEELVRALRCQACHVLGGESDEAARLAAPSLRHAAATLHSDWVEAWLAGDEPTELTERRMPQFSLSPRQASQVAAFLAAPTEAASPQLVNPSAGDAKSLKAGRALLLSVGCLACHRYEGLGKGGIYGGGDLSKIARKRPAGFFDVWLRTPEKLNPHHRMPVFDLTDEERGLLASFLAQAGATDEPDRASANQPAAEAAEAGARVFQQFRCTACHEAPGERPFAAAARTRINAESRWDRACTGAADADGTRPGYGLPDADADAVRTYVAARAQADAPPQHVRGEQLMREHNCVTCHARTDRGGLGDIVNEIADEYPELAAEVPAMTPPSLLSVGDKLQDEALRDAILRKGPVHRPWLSVRMPKFRFDPSQADVIAHHFISADRIPPNAPNARAPYSVDEAAVALAGPRLVSTDGFGCTSCHSVGKVNPPKAPLNARGPDLLMLGERIRQSWFDRWVRNPARIVPRMEMPSVEVAVRGVLDEDVDQQLDAVWQTLNEATFVPPKPNPVRVLRLSGIEDRQERAEVVTDVVRVEDRSFVKPMLIALPNRHSILFDLETARLQRWAIGDAARQRTEGKTWFWEAAGSSLLELHHPQSDVRLTREQTVVDPLQRGQFLTEFDSFSHQDGGMLVEYRLAFPRPAGESDNESATDPQTVHVTQTFSPKYASPNGPHGFTRRLTVRQVPADSRVAISIVPTDRASEATISEDGRSLLLDDTGSVRVRVLAPASAKIQDDGTVTVEPNEVGTARLELGYQTNLPIDQYPVVPPPPFQPDAETLNVVPGFHATRLPIAQEVMPTAMDWDEQGTLYLASLKGRVWQLKDADQDGMEEQLIEWSDELAAPFGIVATPQASRETDSPAKPSTAHSIDVVTKYALLRITDEDGDGRPDRTDTLASGWGHTTDYHDWAIGIPRDQDGCYYISIACQQDERTDAAAYLRGTVVRLVPRRPTADDPRLFALDPISGGHRFPVGIARNRQGDLYVTDNQGNYNPFNELNHVIEGARYGFINRNERKPDFKPPLTPPAINIPHPWTRSVNGICFLETPSGLEEPSTESAFGPFEGHLVGCEYDTRRLIRMSLQKVGDTVQGAAYPLSLYHPTDGKTFLGPITCAVSPGGELYVGCIRDSGWGGANNIGGLVKLRFDAESLPAGIAEVTARHDGFVIHFTQPVDRGRAGDPKNYSISSYRRISTPAYGGPDVDRRTESIRSVVVSEDGRSATVSLAQWREGFVYEIRCKPLVSDDQEFFPAEAYYTLRVAPSETDANH